MSAKATGGGPSAVVVHGNGTHFERNGLARKIADRGVEVRRVYAVDRAGDIRNHDYGGVDLVLVIESALPNGILKEIRDAATHYGARVIRLQHQTSHASWRELEAAAGSAPAEDAPSAVVVNLRAPEAAKSKKTLAQEVAESEELTRLAIEENAELRTRVKEAEARAEALGLEIEGLRKSSDAQARERLAADLARKEAERARAVREGAEATDRLTKQLEATEALRRTAVAERDTARKHALPDPGPELGQLARVRKIVAACADGILTADEALAKLQAVLA